MQAIEVPRTLREQGNSYSSTNGEIWRDAMGFYRLEAPPPPVHAPHCIRCDTLSAEEQIGLAQRRIDKCNGEVKECRTRQSNYKRSSSHWKSLQETIDSREEEIVQEQQYIQLLGGHPASSDPPLSHKPKPVVPATEYASINELEQSVRRWVFSPDYPDQALEKIKAKTPEGKQLLKSLGVLIGVPCRVADLRQACHNVRSALGGSANASGFASLALSHLSPQAQQPPQVVDTSEPGQLATAPESDIPLTPTTKLLEELSPEEESERHRLELKVERAFYEAGAALAELRDKRLYRSTHRTFEEYVLARFGMKRAHSYRLIEAVAVVDNLTSCLQFGDILPVNEAQCRELAKLEPAQQPTAWLESLKRTGGKKAPPAVTVRGVVTEIKERDAVPPAIPYQVGDVFLIVAKSGEFRKYNGCWAIATAVNNFTVEVEVYDAVLTVKPDNLEPIDSPAEREQVRAIAARIKRLRACELDRGAYPILESLKRHTYLTPLEEELLAFLEKRYLEASFDVR